MGLIYLAVLFFVVIFSAFLQLLLKNPYAVAAVVALISLVVYAFFSATLTTIFIVWIVIYTLAALLSAFVTKALLGRNHDGCNRCDRNF